METANRGVWNWLKANLPEGRALPDTVWAARHRFVLGFIGVHAVGLAIFGLVRGWSPAYALGEGGLIGLLGLVAMPRVFNRSFRSGVAAFACATSSAVLTQFWGGFIEGHFHYFVIVALIALYQDWVPFLLAIGFVALDHGVIGTLLPTWVYNHPAAIAHPWTWAVIHAVLVLAECACLVVLWKSNEQARARTDLVLSSASEGILGLDLAGRVTFVNPSAVTMLGQSENALVGQTVERVLAAATEGAAQLDLSVIGFGQNGALQQGTGHVVFHRSGIRVPLDWNANPVREHGAIVGTVLTLQDASPRMRAEEERGKRLQQVSEVERLKELDKFRSLFLNTAAHELHTPLTPLRLNVYALKEGLKGELNADQKSTVDVLDRNVERLSHLVEDVLNAARLQANRMMIQKKPFDLATLAHDAVDSFQETARSGGVLLEAHLTPGVIVEGDDKRLNQVLFNLLDNALKFTPAKGTVRVDVAREAGGAVVRVRDSGVGIRREDVARLFQPYVQAHNPMEQTRVGSGLGLYISRGIVELHGGRIECQSGGPGKGSTFSVFLPVTEVTMSAAKAAPAAA